MTKFHPRHNTVRPIYRSLALILLFVCCVNGLELTIWLVNVENLDLFALLKLFLTSLMVLVSLQVIFWGRAPQWLVPTSEQR